MWRRARTALIKSNLRRRNLRCFSSSIRHTHVEDEGDFSYSSEWWGKDSGDGDTVLRSFSDKGNGSVSVLAYPSSRPDSVQREVMEKWLNRRYGELHPENDQSGNFDVLGYQWRVLRFNDFTRQTTVKIMAAQRKSDPTSLCFMQQPHILAVPYIKSMISVGLATIASSTCDFRKAVYGEKTLRVLCIGHGGGSLPLFLASKIQGAVVHVVEIDPLVISASVQAMGFPAYAVMKSSNERAIAHPKLIDEVLWKGTHERLFLFESDAENFILNNTNLYDIVFIDAYDGDDIFPHKLWDCKGSFLEALRNRLHPEHGTVVVNLHADADFLDIEQGSSFPNQLLPMGKYVSRVCRAYKDVLVRRGDSEDSGLGYIVQVPWLCNASLVVCRGLMHGSKLLQRDWVLNTFISKSLEVEKLLNLPFSCLQYIKRGFMLVD
ncbi:hypothetical protein Sjap_008577 [Stephania japonica]|uniref:S-adenosyl-L-methionine-dependent methyltransferase n=1 Tax=Stephania japonica TaxID=461633 RepID=A0AAP0JPR7_9MAGN